MNFYTNQTNSEAFSKTKSNHRARENLQHLTSKWINVSSVYTFITKYMHKKKFMKKREQSWNAIKWF